MTTDTSKPPRTPGVERFELAPGYELVEVIGASSNARALRDQVAAIWQGVPTPVIAQPTASALPKARDTHDKSAAG